ncbi:hypothetical protein ACFLU5_00945 [Bacteroidota bacterium]
MDNLIVYPSPPDTTRIQFLTNISNSEHVDKKRSGFSKFVTGEEKPLPIVKPYGIDIHHGKIYICDIGINGMVIIDLEKKLFEYFKPKGLGQLKTPINCYVDNDSTLYVVDTERRQIVIFDKNLKYVDSFGEVENFKPADVFVRNDSIWVASLKNNALYVYGKDSLNLLHSFPDIESGKDGHLFSPTNIYLTDNNVYVSDFGDFKIKTYTYDGKLIGSVGSYGRNIGQFTRPKGIAVDRESNLYVVDAGFENVQVFNKEGQLLMFFGGSYEGPGDMWLPAKVTIDYDNLEYFQKFVDLRFELQYLIFVTNQYGPDKINVYGYVKQRQQGSGIDVF